MIAIRICILVLGFYYIYKVVTNVLLKEKVNSKKDKILREEELTLDIKEFNKEHRLKTDKIIKNFLEK